MRLLKWTIVPSSTCEMHIEGYCEAGVLLTTANVQRRIRNNRVLCVDGNSYELLGGLDVKSGVGGRIPSRIVDQFVHGVPPGWRQVVRGWSRAAEGTEEINRKTGNNASRGLRIYQRRSPEKKSPSAALSPRRLRPRTRAGNVRGGTAVGVVSNSSAAKTQLTISSGEGKAAKVDVSLSEEKLLASVKNVRVVVEKLRLPAIPQVLGATEATKPSCNAESASSRSGVKTRSQSADSNVPTCGRETRSRRAARLQGDDRLTASNKIATAINTKSRSVSCPAHANVRIGTKTEACLKMVITSARSASAGQSLLASKQDGQGICDAYGELKTSTSSKLAKKKMQDVPAVYRNVSRGGQRLACVASIPPPSQAKLIRQATRTKKMHKQKEEPEPRDIRRVFKGKHTRNDHEPERAPKECQAGTVQGVHTRRHSRGNKMDTGSELAPKSLAVLPDGHNLNLDSPLSSANGRKKTGVQPRSRTACNSIVKKQQEAVRTRTNGSVVVNGQHFFHATLAADSKEPISGKRKFRERSLSRQQDMASRQKNVFSTCENPPVTRKRAASSLPEMLPRKRRAVSIAAEAKIVRGGGVVANQSIPTGRKRMRSGRPQVKVQAYGNSANGNYCRQFRKREAGASVGLGRRNSAGGSRKEPYKSSPDTAKAADSNIIEKALPGPVLSLRLTRKSIQQSMKQELKNCDKGGKREKPKSQDGERSSAEKSICNGCVTKSTPEEDKGRASHGVSTPGECYIAGGSVESGEGGELVAKPLCSLPVRRKLKLNSPCEKASRRQEANVQCRTQPLRGYPVIKQQKPAKTGRKNSSTVINSQHAISKAEGTQQVSDQPILDEKSLSGHQNASASLSRVSTMGNCASTLSSGMGPKRRTARNFAEVKAAGSGSKKKGNAMGGSREQKQSEHPEQQVCNSVTNTNCYELKCPAKARGLTDLTEKKKSKSREPSKLGAAHASKMVKREIVELRAESSPSNKKARTSKTHKQNLKQKHSLNAAEITKALLAVTARKGTLKRKAQIRNLASSLAAKDSCDDFYHDHHQSATIPSALFDAERDKLSVCRLSGMTTPTPNSPLMAQVSPMSTSSIGSASTLPSPSAMDAIVLSIQKPEKTAALSSTTPKPKHKTQVWKTVIKDLQKLEKKLEQRHLKENCAESDEDAEECDSDDDSAFA